jgi:hypothetical protein
MSVDEKSNYYDAGGLEAIEVIKAKLTPDQYIGFLLGNQLKYSQRANFKGSFDRDIEKVSIYSKMLTEFLEVKEKVNRGSAEIKRSAILYSTTGKKEIPENKSFNKNVFDDNFSADFKNLMHFYSARDVETFYFLFLWNAENEITVP